MNAVCAVHNSIKIKSHNMKLIIDGSNLMHRSYWVSEKVNKSVVELFLGSLRKLHNDFTPSDVYIVWDARLIKGVKNYRRQEETYKADRDKERWKKVYAKEKVIRKLCESLGLYNMYPGVLEADDFIYFICKNEPGIKTVVTSDQDLLQVVNDHTTVYNPIKKFLYDPLTFREQFSIPLSDFVSYKALMGDKSDNIQGVPGVGPKRALRIIAKGIDESLSSNDIKTYKHNIDLIDLNRGLVHHPEERSIYQYQLKNTTKIEPDYNMFVQLCSDNDVELQYDFTGFFSNHINNTVVDVLR